jgi:hypothetical protein
MYNYCREKTAMGKGGLTKWFKMAEEYSTLRFVEYREFIQKENWLKDYDKITDTIIDDILII